VQYKDLSKIYRLADIFVLLTQAKATAEEGWGTVFLEAAACGLPVVAERVGGVGEAVEHGITGLVVDTIEEEQVTASIAELLNNRSFAKVLGEQGRKRVEEKFRWKKQLITLVI
jgi:phosphatidylinositol alpha-1,6-mannosyltransferase